MNEARWIIVRNWDRFQHYKDRDPPWIKDYTEQLDDPAYLELTGVQRAALQGIRLKYATSRRQVRDSTRLLSRQLNMRVTRETLEALNHAGFIEFSASKPLADCKQDASARATREEAETDKERTARTRANGKPPKTFTEEVRPLINVVDACQHFIEGWGWDETFTEHMMLEEFHRISKSHRTEGSIGAAELQGLKEQWKATRQDRYGIKANLTA